MTSNQIQSQICFSIFSDSTSFCHLNYSAGQTATNYKTDYSATNPTVLGSKYLSSSLCACKGCACSLISPHSFSVFLNMLSTSSCVSVRSQNRILILYLCSQNILEMKVYDENAVTKDDLLFTVLFDVAKVQLGETVHLTFHLNRKVSDKTALVTGRKYIFWYYLLNKFFSSNLFFLVCTSYTLWRIFQILISKVEKDTILKAFASSSNLLGVFPTPELPFFPSFLTPLLK